MSAYASQHYDVIVIGLGAMGSATAYHLARRGHRVLGIESHGIPNERGSSRGQTRILRLAYYEAPEYVPFVLRARELWFELEKQIGKRLLYVTGSVDAGPPDSPLVVGANKSCRLHNIHHIALTSTELTRRFPAFRLPQSLVAVLQPDGGVLCADRCILAHVTLAQHFGARIEAHENVLLWEPTSSGVLVVTDRGRYTSDHLVITAGVWADQLVKALRHRISAERQVIGWFQPRKPHLFLPSRMPVFNAHLEEGHFAGIPMFRNQGFKYARAHHLAEIVSPDCYEKRVSARDVQIVRSTLERYFPDAAGPTNALETCLFENSPDGHFIIDRLPDYQQVSFAAGFSGHGFKFSSVVGESMCRLVEDQVDTGLTKLFRVKRFEMNAAPGIHLQPAKMASGPSAGGPTADAGNYCSDKADSTS